MKGIGILLALLLLCAFVVVAQDNQTTTTTTQTTTTTNKIITILPPRARRTVIGTPLATRRSSRIARPTRMPRTQDRNTADQEKADAKNEGTKSGEERDKVMARLDDSSKILNELLGAPDKGIPDEVFEHAKCVAVVPSMVKGGFVFGAEHGRGVATCRTANGAGARRLSSSSPAVAGDCKSACRPRTWSC